MPQLEHQDRIDELLHEVQSILLSTVHQDGSSLASYTLMPSTAIRLVSGF